MTGMDHFLETNDLFWLADSGYHHHRLIRPDRDRAQTWNHEQKSLRSVVEVVFGFVRQFSFASGRVRQSPEIQEMALIFLYNIVNMRLRKLPIRPQYP